MYTHPNFYRIQRTLVKLTQTGEEKKTAGEGTFALTGTGGFVL